MFALQRCILWSESLTGCWVYGSRLSCEVLFHYHWSCWSVFSWVISQHRVRFNDSGGYWNVEEVIIFFHSSQELPTKERYLSLVGLRFISLPSTGCCLSCLVCESDQANKTTINLRGALTETSITYSTITTINPSRGMSAWIHSHSWVSVCIVFVHTLCSDN